MAKKTKLRIIKRLIKITIAICVLIALVFLGFFVKYNYTFENSDMSKWLTLSENQRFSTLRRVIPDHDIDQNLLIQCVTKIAELPDSDKMDIRDAIALCYSGIKTNTNTNNEK